MKLLDNLTLWHPCPRCHGAIWFDFAPLRSAALTMTGMDLRSAALTMTGMDLRSAALTMTRVDFAMTGTF